jgi:hypothetical protein
MNAWWWVLWVYLAVGGATWAVQVAIALVSRIRDPDSLSLALARIHREQMTTSGRVLDMVLVQPLAHLMLVCGWPYAWTLMWRQRRQPTGVSEPPEAMPEFKVEPSHLRACWRVDEIEARERVSDPLGSAPSQPFGFLSAQWAAVVEDLQPSDELWTFSAQWLDFLSRELHLEGYVRLRRGQPGPFVITVREWVDREVDALFETVGIQPARPSPYRP